MRLLLFLYICAFKCADLAEVAHSWTLDEDLFCMDVKNARCECELLVIEKTHE